MFEIYFRFFVDFGNVQFPDVVGLGSEFTKPIVEAVDRNSFFSPSASYGLYTPPPSTPGAADGQGIMQCS